MSRAFFIICLIILLAITSLLSPPAQAVERCVLVELMTWVNCPGCPYAEAALDSLGAEYSDSSLAIIRNHAFPYPSNPFKDLQLEGYFRWKYYYDQSDVPVAAFDGGMLVAGADDSTTYQEYRDSIEARLSVPSPLQITASVFYDTLTRAGTAIAQVTALNPTGPGDLRLRWVLVESELESGGEEYDQVLRDMLPDTLGISFTIAAGEMEQYVVPFEVDSTWVPENCGLVVFVQDDATKEVLQSAQCGYPSWTPPMVIPRAVDDLKITLCGSDLHLSWSPVTEDLIGDPLTIDYYRIYGATARFPTTPTKTLIDSTADLFFLDGYCSQVGNLRFNCSFHVTAVAAGLESTPSNEVGEFDNLLRRVK